MKIILTFLLLTYSTLVFAEKPKDTELYIKEIDKDLIELSHKLTKEGYNEKIHQSINLLLTVRSMIKTGEVK